MKDLGDPRWASDYGCKKWSTFAAKYLAPADLVDSNAIAAFDSAAMLI